MATKVTRDSVVAVARKNIPRAMIRENKRWPSDKKMADARERAVAREAERTTINAELDKLSSFMSLAVELAKAAQFVIDVDGDDPSIPQMAQPTRDILRRAELERRLSELREAGRQENWIFHTRRYEIYDDGPICRTIHASANTLSELLEKITRNR